MEQELQHKAGDLSPSLLKDQIVGDADQTSSLIDVSATDTQFIPNTIKCSSRGKFINFEKLNLNFNGSSCPLEFLTRLEELKPLKNFDDVQSLLALPVLLSGIALKWYRGKKHEINSWSHFKVLFLERFVPFGHNFDLEKKIRNLKQGKTETLTDFITEVVDLSSKLIHPLTEPVLLDIIKDNMLPEYAWHLVGRSVLTLNELSRLGREIESLQIKLVTPVESVAAVLPSSSNLVCHKCKLAGHDHRACRKIPGICCFKCGHRGVVTRHCPKCNPTMESPKISNSKVDKPSKN